ncbi:MAG: hypothetical protein JRG91_17470 [Deltaproteobacteria bacterium]|nr:hypothetical protein [Deltaproteobacteria bacterium]
MRLLALALLLVLAAPGHALGQDDPCAGVSCSNHGTCVTRDGDPACACDEGYFPDETTGLSCQPVPEPAAAKGPDMKMARGVALAGVGVTAAALAVHLGKVALVSFIIGKEPLTFGERDASYGAWFVLHPSETVLHSGGVAMALGGAMAIRRSLGMKMTTPVNIAGWVLYSTTWVIEALSFLPSLPGVEIPFILTSAGLAIADAMAAKKLSDGAQGLAVRGPRLVPGFVPLPGGGAVTVGGWF